MAPSPAHSGSIDMQAPYSSSQTSKDNNSIGTKVKSLKNLFHHGHSDSVSRQSSTSGSFLSELGPFPDIEEKNSPVHVPNVVSSDFKASLANNFMGPVLKNGIADSNDTSIDEEPEPVLHDEDIAAYLRKPKRVKILKRCVSTAAVCKRLFLAQELDHNANSGTSDLDAAPFHGDLDLGEDFESNNDREKCPTPDSMGGQNVKARDRSDKKSIWALVFSMDGKYLASAGKGDEIKIWKVIGSSLDRIHLPKPSRCKVPFGYVFQPSPVNVFKGHTNDVLSLDWSKNNFLLSSSMDKTVKLWTLKKNTPLRTFEHDDFVTCVKFHPLDDRFFVSGCLDHKVRLWSILENEISYEFDAKDLVTAIGFTPNGNLTIVGTFSGTIYFLDTSKLELRHSIQMNKKRTYPGAKVTGIETFTEAGDIKILITSNDSKIRLVSLRNRQLESYFKGFENNSSQITATVSDDKRYVISGSEDHHVYVWDIHKQEKGHDTLSKLLSNKYKRKDYTSFHAHHSVVTAALIAPLGTLKALSLSDDFIFEFNSDLARTGVSHLSGLQSDMSINSQATIYADSNESSLFDKSLIGSVIVTADDLGLIRVFRQDLSPEARSILEKRTGKEGGNTGKSSKKGTSSLVPSQPSQDPTNRDLRTLMNRTFNGSSHSLLSRGLSCRAHGDEGNESTNGHSGYLDSGSSKARSRSATDATIDSITKNFSSTLSSGIDEAKNRNSLSLICDVCGGDKFSATRVSGINGGFRTVFFCTDCGNQLHT